MASFFLFFPMVCFTRENCVCVLSRQDQEKDQSPQYFLRIIVTK